jgi:ribosome-associated translation inhibitor RaiA
MTKKLAAVKRKLTILEDLCNAQQELIAIFEITLNAVDAADVAIASVTDPYDGSIIGKDLHELRGQHVDREAELYAEIDNLFDKLEGKLEKTNEDSSV